MSELQSRLSELGYYVGRISGNFLEGTQNGVKRFQEDYGLEVTGELDPESAELLKKAEYRSLRYGDDGDDVKRLQTVLRELGYLDANSTGKYRAATQEAVADFQQAMGVEATGEADLETAAPALWRYGSGQGARSPHPHRTRTRISAISTTWSWSRTAPAHPTAWAPTNTAAISCNAATRARRSSRCRPA